jgi:hypothetical protein
MVAIQLVPQHSDAATLIFYGTKKRAMLLLSLVHLLPSFAFFGALFSGLHC